MAKKYLYYIGNSSTHFTTYLAVAVGPGRPPHNGPTLADHLNGGHKNRFGGGSEDDQLSVTAEPCVGIRGWGGGVASLVTPQLSTSVTAFSPNRFRYTYDDQGYHTKATFGVRPQEHQGCRFG